MKMTCVCEHDYKNNAKFLGSRNKTIILMLLDTGLRVSELASLKLENMDSERSWIKVKGKWAKERVVRIGASGRKKPWKDSVGTTEKSY
jgi:site-specific recombinase XerD